MSATQRLLTDEEKRDFYLWLHHDVLKVEGLKERLALHVDAFLTRDTLSSAAIRRLEVFEPGLSESFPTVESLHPLDIFCFDYLLVRETGLSKRELERVFKGLRSAYEARQKLPEEGRRRLFVGTGLSWKELRLVLKRIGFEASKEAEKAKGLKRGPRKDMASGL